VTKIKRNKKVKKGKKIKKKKWKVRKTS